MTKLLSKLAIDSRILIIILTLYFGFVLNLSFWRFVSGHIEIGSFQMVIFAFSLIFFILTPFYLLLSIVTLPFLAKPLITLFLLISSAANYYMYEFGVFIDTDMITNIFETTKREAFDLITVWGFLWVFVTGVVPSVILAFTTIRYASVKRELKIRILSAAASLLILLTTAAASYKEYTSFGRNNREVRKLLNTINYTYSTVRYFQRRALTNREFVRLDPDAKVAPFKESHKTVVVLIVGETARADNFYINGYEKNTNPNLAKQDIISFKNVLSCGTATAISVPCMFSNADREYFDVTSAKYTENLLDIAKNAGYDIFWRDNDDGCKGVCDRVPTENMLGSKNSDKFCDKESCFDEVLIEGLEGYLSNITKDTLIILHAMGSHGPTYYKRYPDEFKVFKPTCDTAQIQNCSKEEIVNTYDNTILYTDYIISKTIDTLRKFPDFESGLMYISDHGESLGENNVYLHGMPYVIAPKEQTKVPMILWMSENMQKQDYIDYSCMQEAAKTDAYSHDNIFHSFLGLLEIETKVYKKEYDIFKKCRTKELP
ncbi:MAG: phosphoethanolamine--lipid A transferase [Campylobacteraceae bacterium]|nr:phosphoethanolamine--lipid A transferase [Campylobacteraceae bacterium]